MAFVPDSFGLTDRLSRELQRYIHLCQGRRPKRLSTLCWTWRPPEVSGRDVPGRGDVRRPAFRVAGERNTRAKALPKRSALARRSRRASSDLATKRRAARLSLVNVMYVANVSMIPPSVWNT